MKKLANRGLVFLAGALSLPLAMSPRLTTGVAPDYRGDPRLEALQQFFRKLECPALDYAHVFLEAADSYSLDWRLLPSISYVESTGGKMARNNNFFGWDSGHAEFASPSAGIHEVAWRLSRDQRYRGKTLDEKLATYSAEAGYPQKIKAIMRRIAPFE